MIRWITDHLGTAAFDQAAAVPGVRILDVRDLLDGPGNTHEALADRIQQGVAWLRQDERVVVCCDLGMSRSNSVAAGILSIVRGEPFSAAVREVIRQTGESQVKVEVLGAVRKALAASGLQSADTGRKADRILLTGVSSSVGDAILSRLREIADVIAPTRREIDLCGNAADLDLMVRENNVSRIVHLAHPRVPNTNQAYGESLTMLKNILDPCCENGVHLTYLSCHCVFAGHGAEGFVAREDARLTPCSRLGEQKFLAEQLIAHYKERRALRCALVRTGLIYGALTAKPGFMWAILAKALEDREIVTHRFKNGPPELDLLHVSDLASAVGRIVDSELEEAIHLGSGQGVSTSEIAEQIVAATGSRSKIRQIEFGGLAPNVVLDTSFARERLDWSPELGFDQGLTNWVEQATARLGLQGGPRNVGQD